MVKSVGLLTSHQGYNFGALLQAFALQQTILHLGHSCTIIDYDVPLYGTHRLFHLACTREAIQHNLRVFLTLRSQMSVRKCFASFRAKYLHRTQKAYRCADDLRRDRLDYDAFVVGSDILWHPQLLVRDCGGLYYLDFVSSGRRVAYAPSFGLPEIPQACRARVAAYLRSFDSLSSREEAGCAIIRDLTGREATNVLDPSLLLPATAYDKLADCQQFGTPYILVYGIQQSSDLNDLALAVQKSLKLPLVAVVSTIHRMPSEFKFADKVIAGVGPVEFLGWLRGAQLVCTNSFHGTAFSILYRKPFLSTKSPFMGGRTSNLLERLGLSSRQLSSLSDLPPSPRLLADMDYAPVESRLRKATEESLAYLRGALT